MHEVVLQRTPILESLHPFHGTPTATHIACFERERQTPRISSGALGAGIFGSRDQLHAARNVPLRENPLVVLASLIDGRVARAALANNTLIVAIQIAATKTDSTNSRKKRLH